MEKQIKNKKKIFCKENIPNMLVVFRMILAVVVVVLIMMDSYGFPSKTIYSLKDPFAAKTSGYRMDVDLVMLLAGCFFVLASITDWLDGFLARRKNWVSEFGKFWDPIADKVLINSALIGLAWCSLIPPPFVIIMIARDIIVDARRMVAARKNIVVAANIYGKMKTVLQMVSIIFIFFIFQCRDFVSHAAFYFGVQNLLIYLATIVSVISGIVYFKQINKAVKEAKKEQDAKQN